VINPRSDDVTRQWSVRRVAVVAVVTALLSGCSEKQEASHTLPSTTAAESTPELPPLGPEDFPVPPEAREKTPEGAVDFVRYYASLTKYVAENSLDPEPLLSLSQDCLTCTRIVQSLAADRAANYTYREYVFEFAENGPALIQGDTAQVGFSFVQGPITVVDPSGQVVSDRSAATPEKLPSGAVLLWRDDLSGWVITGLTVG
jgi:hypothetical protein